MTILRSALAIAISTAAISAHSNENIPTLGLHFGYGFGGETLVDTGDEELKAGSGLLFGGFVQVPLTSNNAQPVFAKLGMSYMRDSISASDGDASFDKFPIDALVMTQVNNVKFGAGLTYHLNPTYEEDSDYGDYEVEFDNALGFIVEGDLTLPNSSVEFGLRYTKIDYEVNGIEFDGNGFALTMGSTF